MSDNESHTSTTNWCQVLNDLKFQRWANVHRQQAQFDARRRAQFEFDALQTERQQMFLAERARILLEIQQVQTRFNWK